MVSNYLLVVAGSSLDLTSGFFKITVGSSADDRARLHALSLIAAQHNWYFTPYTHDASDFLLRVALSLNCYPDELNGGTLPIKQFLSVWKSFQKLRDNGSRQNNKPTSARKQATKKRARPPQAVLQHAECVTRNKPKSVETDFMNYIHQIF